LSRRVRQLQFALERWRWIPDSLLGHRPVIGKEADRDANLSTTSQRRVAVAS